VINVTVTVIDIDTTVFCSPGLCQHGGICHEAVDFFRCDCNMTSFVGRTCTDGMTHTLWLFWPSIVINDFKKFSRTTFMYYGCF